MSLPKFEGLVTCPTFNLGGDVKSALLFTQDPNIERSFVGKNVCHTIVYDPKQFDEHEHAVGMAPVFIKSLSDSWMKGQALFLEAMKMFFDNGAPYKMFHDPSAAVCMLHPEIGTWLQGSLYREKGAWGAKLTGT